MLLIPPDLSLNQAMILAAGRGTRLAPLTLKTPKPLLLLNQRPVLDYIFDHLHKAQINHCMVNTHHLADQIETYIKSLSYKKMNISTSFEPTLLETGGGITKALPFFQGHCFFSINGDVWWEDKGESCLNRLKQYWNPHKMDNLLLLIDPPKALGYEGTGDFFLNPEGQLTLKGNHNTAPYIYGGVQILHPRLFKQCQPTPFSLIDLFKKSQETGRLYGLVHKGWWGDMGSFHSLTCINEFLER